MIAVRSLLESRTDPAIVPFHHRAFNFTLGTSDVGCVETVMDGWLTCRDAYLAVALAQAQDPAQVRKWRRWHDSTRNVLALEITRA